MKTGIATIPLDYGKCPKWLFRRIKILGGLISEITIEEFGQEEFLKRLSDPIWFQSLGSLLAFDWNSSGLTVVLTAALKSALQEKKLGIYVAGGKGKTSRKTPNELLIIGEKTGLDGENLTKISKLVAKVDNSLIQDGFNLYHHSFFVTEKGKWLVIQQGMNTDLQRARRYHWFSSQNFVEEPHSGIASDIFLKKVLNLTAKESKANKEGIIKVLNEEKNLSREIEKILSYTNRRKLLRESSRTLFDVSPRVSKNIRDHSRINSHPFTSIKDLSLDNIEFHWHPVVEEKFDLQRIKSGLEKANFLQPKTIEELLLIEGVGPKTIRALSLASELIYGTRPSFEDPARYTFAHGGKDGTPYPVDRQTYDETIKIFHKALQLSKQKKLFLRG